MRTGEGISYQELQAWASLTNRKLKRFETQAIKSLDRIYWKAQNDD